MPENRATRTRWVIQWVNEKGIVVDETPSSTREPRARRHLERVRNSRKSENLNPKLVKLTTPNPR